MLNLDSGAIVSSVAPSCPFWVSTSVSSRSVCDSCPSHNVLLVTFLFPAAAYREPNRPNRRPLRVVALPNPLSPVQSPSVPDAVQLPRRRQICRPLEPLPRHSNLLVLDGDYQPYRRGSRYCLLAFRHPPCAWTCPVTTLGVSSPSSLEASPRHSALTPR